MILQKQITPTLKLKYTLIQFDLRRFDLLCIELVDHVGHEGRRDGSLQQLVEVDAGEKRCAHDLHGARRPAAQPLVLVHLQQTPDTRSGLREKA